MTPIATALKHLMAAGVTGDALIAAIADIEAALPGAQPIEPTRSKAAIRQERYRRNKASQSVTKHNEGATDHNENVTRNAERNADPHPLPPNDLISNPPTPAPENITPAREKRGSAKRKEVLPFVRPDWVPEHPWDGYVEMRTKIRKPMTDNAKWMAVDELRRLTDAGHPPGDVLNQSIFNSYQGLFELKDRRNGNGTGNRNHSPGHLGGRDNRDGFQRALDDELFGDRSSGRPATGGGGGAGELPFAGATALR